jgi:hypothetical protein
VLVSQQADQHVLPGRLRTELGPVKAAAGRTIAGLQAPGSRDEPNIDEATAGQRLSATVPPRFGQVLAIAGARPNSGAWFTAASVQLTLFHVSDAGKLRSWPLLVSSSLRTRSRVGMAVTNSGVVWIGVSSTLIRFDPRSSVVSSWRVPTTRSNRLDDHGAQSGHQATGAAYSVAVAPDGNSASGRSSPPR